jgi:dienelactone hydrolase
MRTRFDYHCAAFATALVLLICGCHEQAAHKTPPASPRPTPPSPDAAVVKAPALVRHETWAISVVLPADIMNLVAHLEQKGGDWQGTVDVLPDKAKDLQLTEIRHDAEHLVFTLVVKGMARQVFALKRAANAKQASGTLTVSGQTFYAKMAELADGEAPHPVIARPQTPMPPYHYAERELTIAAPEDGKLVGTLTLPAGKGPFPAVLLITGSGLQDRDETIFGHRPFLLIADRLTRAGVAVLRVDDRGAGKSTGKPGSLETDVGDSQAELELLLTQPEIDPKRIGLIGHSVGGAIAPILAARTKKVAFIVSLAGTALPGSELVPLQLAADLGAKGVPEETVQQIVEVQRKVGAAIVKGDPPELHEALKAAILGNFALGGQPAPAAPELDKMVEAKLKESQNPWTVSYFKTDPRRAWRQVRAPVLVVIGGKDTQVPAKENLAAVTAALRQAKDRDVTAHEVPGVNHLFQHANKGVVGEYGAIEETFDPATLDEIVKWVADHAHAKAAP